MKQTYICERCKGTEDVEKVKVYLGDCYEKFVIKLCKKCRDEIKGISVFI